MHVYMMHCSGIGKKKEDLDLANPLPRDDRHLFDIERTLDEMKTLRESLSLSQEQLAEIVGVDRSYISKWENRVVPPSFQHLVILWRTLHGLRIEAGVQHG